MRRYYVGLDVHSKDSVYAIQDELGALIGEGSVPTTPEGLLGLRQRYGLPEGTTVGLETGTVAFYVARALQRIGLAPLVIDAHEVRIKAHRPTQKSDRRDAREICEGVRRGQYRSIVHVPPENITTLRDTLARRRHFVRLQTAEVNAVKRLLRAAGLGTLTRRSLRSEVAWDRLHAALSFDASRQGHVALPHVVWSSAGAQITTLESWLDTQRAPFVEAVERLQSVPGVGPIVALTAIAVFSDVDRFASAKHAASYAGLIPSTDQSGDRDAHGRITRRGSTELRAMLARLHIMPDVLTLRSIPTSAVCVYGEDTRWRSSPWRTGCAESCGQCCGIRPRSISTSWGWNVDRSRRPQRICTDSRRTRP